jgi:hypothetical protein
MPGGGELGGQPTRPVRAAPLRPVWHLSADQTNCPQCPPFLSSATVSNCLAALVDGGSYTMLTT